MRSLRSPVHVISSMRSRVAVSAAACLPGLRTQKAAQYARADGLDHVNIESRVSRTLPVLRLTPSCERNEKDVLKPGLRSEAARELVAIHVRHAEIDESDCGRIVASRRKR